MCCSFINNVDALPETGFRHSVQKIRSMILKEKQIVSFIIIIDSTFYALYPTSIHHSPFCRENGSWERRGCRQKPNPQLRLPPHNMHMALTFPVEILVHEFQIVAVQDLGEDEGDFEFGEAVCVREGCV